MSSSKSGNGENPGTERSPPKAPSTKATNNPDTLHFEGLIIDVDVTLEGYTNITTQDMHHVGTCDRETYVAGFGSIPADDRALKLVQKLLDITSVFPE